MLGSKGPRVTLQTPRSSLLNLGAGAEPSQSPVSVTSEALGAKMRKVTRWSDETSGDCSVSLTAGSWRGGWAQAAIAHTVANDITNNERDRCISVPPERVSARIRVPRQDLECARPNLPLAHARGGLA